MQNGFIESFNGRLRDELLNERLFSSLSQARAALARWQLDYNTDRPHSKLRWQTPSAFASTLHPRRNQTLRIMNGSASAPPLSTPDRANPTARTNSPMDRSWGNVNFLGIRSPLNCYFRSLKMVCNVRCPNFGEW